MAKVIGFKEDIAREALKPAQYRENSLFTQACMSANYLSEIPMNKLYTKRQASKFKHKKGFVYKCVNNLL